METFLSSISKYNGIVHNQAHYLIMTCKQKIFFFQIPIVHLFDVNIIFDINCIIDSSMKSRQNELREEPTTIIRTEKGSLFFFAFSLLFFLKCFFYCSNRTRFRMKNSFRVALLYFYDVYKKFLFCFYYLLSMFYAI